MPIYDDTPNRKSRSPVICTGKIRNRADARRGKIEAAEIGSVLVGLDGLIQPTAQ